MAAYIEILSYNYVRCHLTLKYFRKMAGYIEILSYSYVRYHLT